MGKDHLDQVHTIISDQAKVLEIGSGSQERDNVWHATELD